MSDAMIVEPVAELFLAISRFERAELVSRDVRTCLVASSWMVTNARTDSAVKPPSVNMANLRCSLAPLSHKPLTARLIAAAGLLS